VLLGYGDHETSLDGRRDERAKVRGEV